jgi:Putative Actinobacterial Holin-X, holin superfamily III
MPSRSYERSVVDVMTDLLNQLTTLFRKESELARVELSDKMSQIGSGLGLIIGGAVLLMPALVVLLEAGVAGVEKAGFEPWQAAAIVGGGAFLIGLILLLIGVSRLKAKSLMPEKTVHQFQEDVSVAKRQVRQDHEYQRAA